jgi:hypothetical protein
MIERIGSGTYHITVPSRQSWMLLKHIRYTMSQLQLEYRDPFLIVIWEDVKKHNMPDYWHNEIGSMADLAKIGAAGPVFYDVKIFVGDIPLWRRVVYKTVNAGWPQFGRVTHFCDTLEEAIALADELRPQYEALHKVYKVAGD